MSNTVHLPVSWNCNAALKLRFGKTREYAYPFDWTIKNYDSIYISLFDEFSNLLTDYKIGEHTYESFYEDKGIKGEQVLYSVYDYTYQTIFVHDFTEKVSIKEVKEKYIKRMNRLKEHIKQAAEVILYGGSFEETIYDKQVNLQLERLGIDIREVWSHTKSLEDISNILKSWNRSIEVKIKE